MSVYGRNNRRSSYPQRPVEKKPNSDLPPARPLPEPVSEPNEPQKPASEAKSQPNLSAMLSRLIPGAIDSDTLLIAALLLILLKEGGDIRLVLALGYILL